MQRLKFVDENNNPISEPTQPPTIPGVEGAEPQPTAEEKAKRSTLDVAIERHAHLNPDIERFCQRLQAWRVNDPDLQRNYDGMLYRTLSFWKLLGEQLAHMKKESVAIKVTTRSRRDAWMRVGAKVKLREDVLAKFEAVYPPEVLGNLTVNAVLEDSVFLVSGDREIGIVPKAHCVKPGQRGKSEDSKSK